MRGHCENPLCGYPIKKGDDYYRTNGKLYCQLLCATEKEPRYKSPEEQLREVGMSQQDFL